MFFRHRQELWKTLERLETRLDEEIGRRQEYQADLEDMRRELQNFHLDYNNLYEKVRTNLAKLRKRSEIDPPEPPLTDPLTEARNALIQRKLKRSG